MNCLLYTSLIEDAAEAMGATIDGRQCGSFGDYSAVSYNGNGKKESSCFGKRAKSVYLR